MKSLLLIDANSLIHRAFHALPPFTTPDGRPSGALYGVSSVLLKLFREERPEYAAALFDRPEPTFREKEYKEYKAQRPPTPDTLIPQLQDAHELFAAFGVPIFELAGFEADDLIATLAERFGGTPDLRVVILTGDRDTLQLVQGDTIVVKSFRKGVSDTLTYNEDVVKEQYGLSPSQIVDYKALVGDPSDNIKGVAGIGPKSATELLQQFGSVKNIYAHLDDVASDSVREKLRAQEKEAFRSERLVTLERNAPIPIGDRESLRLSDNNQPLVSYFETHGFKTLLARLLGTEASVHKPPKEKTKKQKKVDAETEHQSRLF